MFSSRAFAGEYARLTREIEAMHEMIRVLMREVQELKDARKSDADQRRGPGRPPKRDANDAS